MFSRNIWKTLTTRAQQSDSTSIVVTRKNHPLSRKHISPNALKVLYRLQRAGYEAYLVGGSIRDILLKQATKDFDVVTDAHPEEIRELFSNSRIIGRRFRLVHINFREEIIECSTFRAHQDKADTQDASQGEIQSDNTFGSIEEDVWRRDFTVNALYYNVKDFSIVDYTGGLMDLRHRVMRIIGDPLKRFTEDPVRLLRAIRLAAKLNFSMHPDTEVMVRTQHALLSKVPSSRLFHEWLKLFFHGYAEVTYRKMLDYGYLDALLPTVTKVLKDRDIATDQALFNRALKATDERFAAGQSINPGFLMAVFFWPVVCWHEAQLCHQKLKPAVRFMRAIDLALDETTHLIRLPSRMLHMMRSMWRMQKHLQDPKVRRVDNLYAQRYFRAAYDFLELRAESGEIRFKWPHWWRSYQAGSTKARMRMLRKLQDQQHARRSK
ncbi:MAG: poly(A) polymerase [Coxiellaceae bacterium]|nr:poly(A) polymerase [Coxiellaceae bacterium]|tara:strand:- start:15705 stop:17012 length:1308 start_codon:yes stop_codon:yes gene_type:complete